MVLQNVETVCSFLDQLVDWTLGICTKYDFLNKINVYTMNLNLDHIRFSLSFTFYINGSFQVQVLIGIRR